MFSRMVLFGLAGWVEQGWLLADTLGAGCHAAAGTGARRFRFERSCS